MAETARATSCGTGGRSEVYRRRRPERTVLHRLVRTHLETYLARAQEADPLGDGVPNFVEAQFRAYLRCGILAHGFARARCCGCGHDFLVAVSCKGRGICPSCNSRRMAATAAHLTDHVIPALPVRQWVLSVPKRLRYFLHRDPKTAGAVLHILLRALRRTVREMLGWDHAGGVSLDASVRIAPHDRAGLERLLRYCARPPFALNRIEWRDSRGADGEGVVLYRLPRPAPDGRTVIRLSPLELLDRLAALVPPPRVHRHRYHGVLAPNSPLRSAVVASAGEAALLPVPQTTPPRPVSTLSRRRAHSHSRRVSSRWAALLARIHHARPLVCPECGVSMRLIAFLTDPFCIRDVLSHLGEPVRPPAVHPARGPPELEFGFAEPAADGIDQTPAARPVEPEPIPPYEMDQTRSW